MQNSTAEQNDVQNVRIFVLCTVVQSYDGKKVDVENFS